MVGEFTVAAVADPAVVWITSPALVPYPEALAIMDRRVAEIRAGTASEMIWLLQHPPLYTAGTSADDADLLEPGRFPVYRAGRGGQYTYHGPGQRVIYAMLDLHRRRLDVRAYVWALESWIIGALAILGVHGERRPGRTGVWVARGAGREEKIAAIGVRVRRWVTLHGIALNVDPDLSHFAAIVPCGLSDPGLGVTSLAALGHPASLAAVDAALQEGFTVAFAGGRGNRNLGVA